MKDFSTYTVERAYQMGRGSTLIASYPHPFFDRPDLAAAWAKGRKDALTERKSRKR